MVKLFDITINLKYIILPIVYATIGFISYFAIKKILDKSIRVDKIGLKFHKQRVATLKILILNIIKYIILILVILAILSVCGINIKSIIAGFGITTAIIGLALQDIAKDIIAGISIIAEEQYDVGDIIEVDEFLGEVIFLGLKTTKIKDYKGAIKIISNRYMDKVINYSLADSLAIVDVGVGYEYTPEEVEKVLNDLAKKLTGNIKDATGPVEVLGITNLGDSSVIYRVTVKVKSMQHYAVERLLRKEIKKALDKADITIPFPQVEVHNGK